MSTFSVLKESYQVSDVDHLNGIVNHIFSTRMWPFIEHGFVEDKCDFDEFFDGSDITFDLFFFDFLQQIFCYSLQMASLASFVASGVAFGNGTALGSVVLVLIQNMGMFALKRKSKK